MALLHHAGARSAYAYQNAISFWRTEHDPANIATIRHAALDLIRAIPTRPASRSDATFA
jgi:hypothetical protein